MAPLLAVALFELRQQVQSHVFLVVFVLSAVLVAGAAVLPQLRVAGLGATAGAPAVLRLHLVWSLFFLFTAMAFAADAVLKDEAFRVTPLLASTGVRPLAYSLGRFLGAFAAVVLCYLSVPLGSALARILSGAGSNAGWIPFGEAHAADLARFALPNIFMSCALFFCLATLARTMMAAYLGAVAVLILYGLGQTFSVGRPAAAAVIAEPFGFLAAGRGEVALLALNRAVWLTASAGALVLALARFRFERPSAAAAQRPRRASQPVKAATVPAPVRPRFTPLTPWRQAGARCRFEVGQVIGSPVFAVLLLMTTAGAAAALWSASSLATADLLSRLVDSVRLTPIVVVLYYAGELTWNEQERRVAPLIASTPTPSASFLLPKALALVLTLTALAVVTAGAAAATQVLRGAAALVQPDRLLLWCVSPRIWDWALLACLGMALQAVSPNKLSGWGWMVLFLLTTLGLEVSGLNGGLYRLGGGLDRSLAVTVGPAAIPHPGLLRLYWTAIAILLLIAACALWGRGLEEPVVQRLRAAPRRLGSFGRGIGLAAAILALASGWRLAASS